jgi:hypothetical protein
MPNRPHVALTRRKIRSSSSTVSRFFAIHCEDTHIFAFCQGPYGAESIPTAATADPLNGLQYLTPFEATAII